VNMMFEVVTAATLRGLISTRPMISTTDPADLGWTIFTRPKSIPWLSVCRVSAVATAVVDTAADLTAWTNSFENIQCYDKLKVKAILSEIRGRNTTLRVQPPYLVLFGVNFQAVSVGQKLVENGVEGGYTDALGTPRKLNL